MSFALPLDPQPIRVVQGAVIVVACLSAIVFVLLTPYVFLRGWGVLKPSLLGDRMLILTRWAVGIMGMAMLAQLTLGLVATLVGW